MSWNKITRIIVLWLDKYQLTNSNNEWTQWSEMIQN